MVDANIVRDYLDKALSGKTFFIDSIQAKKAGKRVLLTIAIDSLDSLTLDEIARASRLIDGLLEDAEVVGQDAYTLEVTSRGIDAPLLKPHHFILNIGRLVAITTTTGINQTIRIQDADQETLTTDDGETISYSNIETAYVQIEFNRKSNDED